MEKISFKFKESCHLSKDEIQNIVKQLFPEIKNIKKELNKIYETDYAFGNLCNDSQSLELIQELTKKKLSFTPTVLLLIGIGGSNLGTIAVHEFLNGKFYNIKNSKLKIYFADTTDSDYISDIYNLIEDELKAGANVIINVVSKSGSTTETIANFEIFLELLKKYKKNFNDFIVATTDKSSLLWNYAEKNNYSILEIPKKVGGRFSVLSSVGLFPLAILGIDVKKLLQGAKIALQSCIEENLETNFAAISASIIYLHYKNNIKINDTFLFSNDLEALGKWYRQLMGESIGKELDKQNKKINAGITPTISIGSTDLHSVGQLYLGGPKDKFTTFVEIKKNKTDLKVPNFPDFENIVSNIQGIELSKIMDAIINGTKKAYLKNELPFCSIYLTDKSECSIGQFLQFKMFEIVYLGYLLNINPFDQPNVESYKKETKAILSGTDNE